VWNGKQSPICVDGPQFFWGIGLSDEEYAALLWELRALGPGVVDRSTRSEVHALIDAKWKHMHKLHYDQKEGKSNLAGVIAFGVYG